jgi:hypothetical protein
VDFGTVGEAPPIFAQAAGANLVYVGNEPPSPGSEAIVVPKDSKLRSLADLKGKKVVLNKGSNVHYLLVKALEKAGLGYKDIDVVYLPPADARAAFERGAVDAWAIWDPFLAAAEKQLGARVLADGKGLVANHQFYLAARPYAEKNAISSASCWKKSPRSTSGARRIRRKWRRSCRRKPASMWTWWRWPHRATAMASSRSPARCWSSSKSRCLRQPETDPKPIVKETAGQTAP